MAKICIIGAGSAVFTKRIVTDVLLTDEFRDIEVALMDIDATRLKNSETVVRALAERIAPDAKVVATLDRREALRDASYVLTSIQVAGFDPGMLIDFKLPRDKYGLRQTIADTMGIGGIMRGLRTIPVLLDIGNDMEELCPDALWLQYVNPMAMNMIAIGRKLQGIQAIGLCHSVQGTAEMLADDMGIDHSEIDFDCAGINHMAFYTRFERRANGNSEDLYPKMREVARQIVSGERASTRTSVPLAHGRCLAEKVRYEMLLRLGYFVTESSEHFSEYVPWFIKRDRPDVIERFDVPLDEYMDRVEAQNRMWQDVDRMLEDVAKDEHSISNEYASSIMRAHATGNKFSLNGNVYNAEGLVPNLPATCSVEVPCEVDGKGFHPRSVPALPPHLAALIQTNVNVQQLTVDAVLEGKREHVYHAAMLDPHTAAELSLDEIWSLVDDMIEAHGDYIPEGLRN